MPSQHCPICKTRLWTEPLLTPSRLRCPRCGSEFKPTVPWHYVRILLVVVVALAALVIVLLTQGNILWLLFFLIVGGLAGSLWYLSRLIDLKQIGPELTTEEGLMDSKQLELELEDANQAARDQEARDRQRFHRSVCLLLALGLIMVCLVILWATT